MERLTKRDRFTEIYYDQTDAPVQICTYDLKLIRKLQSLAEDCPELCRLVDADEDGCRRFEADRHRISIHVTRPYPDERRLRQSQWAKEHGLNGRIRAGTVPEESDEGVR